MSNYGVKEFFLYNAYKKNYKLYEQMIRRFFKNKSYAVLQEIRKLTQRGHPIANDKFYEIYKNHIEMFKPDIQKLLAANTGRQINFIKGVEQLFGDEKNIPNSNSVYVDYGCNDGAFAVAMAKRFNIAPSNVYCCDIINKPILVEKSKFNYIQIDLNNIQDSLNKLPKTDLLTVINVLHHIPPESRGNVFQAFDKCLKSGANIIFKEHNCNPGIFNDTYKDFIREWHKLYAVLYNETDFMGDINFLSFDHLKAYMSIAHSLMKSYISDSDDDILKSYYALFVKFRPISI